MGLNERLCIRGCVYRDAHLLGCTGDPRSSAYDGHQCGGCEPAPALDGSLLCDHCTRRLRNQLAEAPDLVAHLRSLIDPQKAQVYDREKLGGKPPSESQPPMSADLVDAADAVQQILVWWAGWFGDTTDYRRWKSVPAGAGAVRAHGAADWAAQYLLSHMETIGNDSMVRLFAAAVLDVPHDPNPAEHVEWTIAKVARRWQMRERPRFARMPCPRCELRVVLVRPPRREGDERTYQCNNERCGWDPPENEREIWAMYFEAGVVA